MIDSWIMELKQQAAIKETIMVVMTAMGDRGDAKRFPDIGLAAYLAKPVKPQERSGMLDRHLLQK